MFFVTYVRRELRRRIRQAVVIALGLALGVGLVVTVSAASAGTTKAESSVLSSLYGVGTDVTVTGPPVGTGRFGNAKPGGPSATPMMTALTPNASGAEVCRYTGGPHEHGTCTEMRAGQSIVEVLGAPYSAFRSVDVADVARLHGVSAAAGGLLLSVMSDTIPRFVAHPAGPLTLSAPSFFFSVDGVDTGRLALSPLSAGTIISGHSFSATDADADVAVVDSGYAASHHLTAGSVITIANVPGVTGVRFTVIGIVRQPTATSPDDVYIPLARAQALIDPSGSAMTGQLDMIYVTAASAADIPAVRHEIAALLPHDPVTTQASLASVVTTSLASAARLAGDLGQWLAVVVLIAAFAVACLLTLGAVARRAAEFGTLKALGWRTRRIIAQVLGESLAMSIAGAAAGVGLGFAGAAIITAVAPAVSATVPGSSGASPYATGPGVPTGELDPATASHALAIPLHPAVTAGVIVLAVVLAAAGGLLAGALGSWRIARLRPADALALVG
jgi:putative ABC transport system permease protein